MNTNDRVALKIQAELLGIICVFQQKIQMLKQELAGYSEFDARTAFCCIDTDMKGYINTNNLRSLTSRLSQQYRGLSSLPSNQFEWFLRKYGSQNKMSYEQFLLLLLPKNNPSLAQTLMVKNPNNMRLPDYLKERFESLIGYYFIMILETQERKQVLYKHFRLSILELKNSLNRVISNENGLYGFINNNGYDINRNVVRYLVNHISSKLPLKDFHENQYRQIFSPIDSISFASFQPLSLRQQTLNYSPLFKQTFRQKSPNPAATKQSFADSFYQRSKDNYLTIKFDTIRQGSHTNRTHYSSNQNIQANLLPVIQEIYSAQSIPGMNGKERLNYSPIIKESTKQFESIDLPGVIDNFATNKNISIMSNQLNQQMIAKQTSHRYNEIPNDHGRSNSILPPPQTNTFIIDKFLKHNSSPVKNYKPQKEIFEDDLEESVNNAIRYY